MLIVAAGVAGYFLGSIPTGLVVCLPLGLDPRQVGSGRTGGTNVHRTAGFPFALLTVLGDVAKGFAAVWLARHMVGPTDAELAAAVAALAAILGHNYSVFVGFKGGAGSSPNLGALAAFDPQLAVLGLAVGASVLFGLRIASVASLSLSAVVLAGLAWQVTSAGRDPSHLIYGVGQLVLVAWALRPNLSRLARGEERRVEFGRRRTEADGTEP